jgi:hypothetical protein
MTTRHSTPVDLEKTSPGGALVRNERDTDRGAECYFASPMDFPAYLRFVRTVEWDEDGTMNTGNHLSTTLEVDLYTLGVKVWLKYDRAKGRVNLLTQAPGDEKPVVVTRWDKPVPVEAPAETEEAES